MIKLILLSHGSLAAGLREAAEMILGEQEQLEVFGLYPGETLDSFAEKVEKQVDLYGDPDNTLILADLLGGTPSNTAMLMVLKHHVHAMVGCNLPVLLEVLSMRQEDDMGDLIQEALSVGANSIVDAEKLLAER